MISRKTLAFTLNELIIVVVIAGILASIAIPSYFRSVEISRAREARSALGLIQAGQRIYYTRTNFYLGTCVIADINRDLGLNLEESYWSYCANANPPNDIGTAAHGACTYTLDETGAVSGNAFCPE